MLGTLLLKQSLALPAEDAVPGVLALLARSQGSGGVAGLRNRQLLSTHYIAEVLPHRAATEWAEMQQRARPALTAEGRTLLSALGYRIVEAEPRELVLQAGERPVALAHIYTSGANLDRIREADGAPPAAHLLARARARGLERAFLVSGPVIRLYTTKPVEELEESVAPAAFLEVETRLLPSDRAGLLWACFSVDAVQPGGSLDRLFDESRRFAVKLRERFRDRVYLEVVPRLVKGLAAAARTAHEPAHADLLYRATLALLFRLLFVLYAEDRNLLPLENPYYRQHSLTARLEQVRAITEGQGRGFDERSTDLWDDLGQIFAAVRDGHKEWGIPPYNGGLFEDAISKDRPEGRFLSAVKLPNAILGPTLYHLAIDRDQEGSGKVDFGDLGVRHIGTIYEGLLSYQVAFAETDLTVDPKDPDQVYRPASSGEVVEVRHGEAYLQSPRGGRKMTGSYYTPAFVVDRLVEQAMLRVLDLHLASLRRTPESEAAERLFDFKICDPAAGSGHFLVQAVDRATEAIMGLLVERRLPSVVAELDRARAQITTIGRAYGAEGLGEKVGDADLLRRLVLKRCIYGVDLNPMAIELARLSLWLHAFVPGLPLSYLGHTLRNGNSLVGVSGADLDRHLETSANLWGHVLQDALGSALEEARSIGGIPDLELGDIKESSRRQEDLEKKTSGLRQVFNLYSASSFEDGLRRDDLLLYGSLDHLLAGEIPPEWRRQSEFSDTFADEQRALHWQLAFPEVFLRQRPGFDVILANPPWEEVTVEELGFFVRYLPGLKSERSQQEQQRRIGAYGRSHPELRERYESETEQTQELRAYLGFHYELTQSGDPDYYKAFAERFLQLCRSGGAIGVVLPRSAFAADGTAPFRKKLFSACERVSLDFLLNNRQWVFPDVHPQYTIALCVAEVGEAAVDAVISTAGPAENRQQFDRIDQERIDWKASDLGKLSEGYEVPLIPGRAAGELFHRLCEAHPPFRSDRGGFKPIPWRELDLTNDRKSGLLRESGPGWPVFTGESIDLWNSDHEKPPFVLPPKEGLAHLQQKRLRSGLWKSNFPSSMLRDTSTLPQHKARILFRDVTNRTNSRTVIACLAPPNVFAVNKAPSLLFPRGDETDVAYVLGVICSMPFDWLARRRVEINLNFFILEALPLPRPQRDDPIRGKIIQVAGRLACSDERFADFASAIGVKVGKLEPTHKAELIAELDALVSQLYGLTEADVRLMFQDFPATEQGISPTRRDLVLGHLTTSLAS